jgi:hypothetical protein
MRQPVRLGSNEASSDPALPAFGLALTMNATATANGETSETHVYAALDEIYRRCRTRIADSTDLDPIAFPRQNDKDHSGAIVPWIGVRSWVTHSPPVTDVCRDTVGTVAIKMNIKKYRITDKSMPKNFELFVLQLVSIEENLERFRSSQIGVDDNSAFQLQGVLFATNTITLDRLRRIA